MYSHILSFILNISVMEMFCILNIVLMINYNSLKNRKDDGYYWESVNTMCTVILFSILFKMFGAILLFYGTSNH